jgi:hypothetical protein
MDDISRASTTKKGVVTANDVGLCSDQGEKHKTFDQQQQKSDLSLHRLATKPGLAHHIVITHWIQMDDISRASTTYKGVVSA